MTDRAAANRGGFWANATGEQAIDRYQALVNVVVDGIYQLDPEYRFVAVNDRFVELTGYSRQELLGEHVSLVLDGTDVARFEQEIRTRFEDDADTDTTFEFGIEAAGGERIRSTWRCNLLRTDDVFDGIVGVVRDTEIDDFDTDTQSGETDQGCGGIEIRHRETGNGDRGTNIQDRNPTIGTRSGRRTNRSPRLSTRLTSACSFSTRHSMSSGSTRPSNNTLVWIGPTSSVETSARLSMRR